MSSCRIVCHSFPWRGCLGVSACLGGVLKSLGLDGYRVIEVMSQDQGFYVAGVSKEVRTMVLYWVWLQYSIGIYMSRRLAAEYAGVDSLDAGLGPRHLCQPCKAYGTELGIQNIATVLKSFRI